ncbi:hypothetical protein BH11PSE12_BH11PSE12_34220 [soil metagenome]
MVTVFALTLVFADGYLGGSTHAQDFKDKQLCIQQGSKMVSQYTSWGHPASFNCVKTIAQKRIGKPEVIQHDFPTLPSD